MLNNVQVVRNHTRENNQDANRAETSNDKQRPMTETISDEGKTITYLTKTIIK